MCGELPLLGLKYVVHKHMKIGETKCDSCQKWVRHGIFLYYYCEDIAIHLNPLQIIV